MNGVRVALLLLSAVIGSVAVAQDARNQTGSAITVDRIQSDTLLDRRETAMTNRTRPTGSIHIAISGLALASVLMSVGCAQAIARHDLFEGSDSRLQRAVQTARRTCQAQQPKQALPSTADYERCVLVDLRRAELTAANR